VGKERIRCCPVLNMLLRGMRDGFQCKCVLGMNSGTRDGFIGDRPEGLPGIFLGRSGYARAAERLLVPGHMKSIPPYRLMGFEYCPDAVKFALNSLVDT